MIYRKVTRYDFLVDSTQLLQLLPDRGSNFNFGTGNCRQKEKDPPANNGLSLLKGREIRSFGWDRQLLASRTVPEFSERLMLRGIVSHLGQRRVEEHFLKLLEDGRKRIARFRTLRVETAQPMEKQPDAILRKFLYTILAVTSLGAILGRILAVDSVDRRALQEVRLRQIPTELEKHRQRLAAKGLDSEEIEKSLGDLRQRLYEQAILCRPFLSANDRSRWATVRALVEPDMRVAGAPYAIDRVIKDPLWDTIDMVKHDGHLYSSKPPFLATLMAIPYWLLYNLAGWSLGERAYLVGRILLVLGNLVPLVLYFWLLARMVERYGPGTISRVFVYAAGCFATFLTTFAVTFNNHLPAAIATTAGLYLAMEIFLGGKHTYKHYFLCGLAAGFAAACEMPALAFLVAIAGLLVLPAAKGKGSPLYCQSSPVPTQSGLPPQSPATPAPGLWRRLQLILLGFFPPVALLGAIYFGTNWVAHRSLRPPYLHRSQTNPADNWYIFSYERQGRVIQSYWTNPVGIDRGEPNPWVYAFHVLVGHHGIFSLTPVWLLVPIGIFLWLYRPPEPGMWWIVFLIAAISIACVGFYVLRPEMDRNYGGMTSGFRWVFWLSPLWLFAMLPAVENLAKSRWGWALCLVLLALSAMSAHYPTWNPWVHPWLYEWLYQLGWITH